jgi:hypothetical protein
MTALALGVVLAIPILGLITLLRLTTVLERRREQVIARQIALTDAIHRVLGPVVAPIVRRRRGGWTGVLPVAAGEPDVGLMVSIAQAELGPTAEIVLVGQEPLPAHPRRQPAATPLAA